MQKLKNTLLEKLINSGVTNTELSLLVYISHYQFDKGNVMGVYYKDACNDIGISYQAFYDALYGLRDKNIIKVEKGSYYDWNVLILDNDFSYEEANMEGYVSTRQELFHMKEFYDLKANEKLLLLYVNKMVGANKGKFNIKSEKLFEMFTRMLSVSKRVVQGYLRSLKKFFYINVYERKYWFSLRKNSRKEDFTDKNQVVLNLVRSTCRRNRAEYNKKTYSNILDIARQYQKEHKNNLFKSFSRAVERSFEIRNEFKSNKYKWNRTLYPAFIHKLLRQELGLEIAN